MPAFAFTICFEVHMLNIILVLAALFVSTGALIYFLFYKNMLHLVRLLLVVWCIELDGLILAAFVAFVRFLITGTI